MKVRKEKDSILLVDDEEGIRKVLGISLEDLGYEVHTAEDGEAAMALFRKILPRIMLTDIKMPKMDGIELLRLVKKEYPETEVIMITGHGDLDLAVKSLKFEATDFITKPIREDALEIALKRAHERIDTRRQLRLYTEELERLVEEKTEKLLEAERMGAIGRTVADLSHAIKNIAGGLSGGGYVLEQGLAQKDMDCLRQGWQMIKDNVDKIAKLSMDLLHYAKTTRIRYAFCDPNEPAVRACEWMRGRAEQNGISLVMEPAPYPDEFRMDPDGIERSLLNLIVNAIDACMETKDPSQGKKVVVKILPGPDKGITYEVSDNGCGMDEKTREKIFQRFFTTKGNRGAGLGLMMTRNIVEKHGGKIFAEPAESGGTRFVIMLPYGVEEDS